MECVCGKCSYSKTFTQCLLSANQADSKTKQTIACKLPCVYRFCSFCQWCKTLPWHCTHTTIYCHIFAGFVHPVSVKPTPHTAHTAIYCHLLTNFVHSVSVQPSPATVHTHHYLLSCVYRFCSSCQCTTLSCHCTHHYLLSSVYRFCSSCQCTTLPWHCTHHYLLSSVNRFCSSCQWCTTHSWHCAHHYLLSCVYRFCSSCQCTTLPSHCTSLSIVLCLQVLFILSVVYNPPLTLGTYMYPPWASALGWVISCSSLVCLPSYMIYRLTKTRGSLMDVSSMNNLNTVELVYIEQL